MFKHALAVAIVAVCAGCSTTSTPETVGPAPVNADELKLSLDNSEARMLAVIDRGNLDTQEKLSELNSAIASLDKNLASLKQRNQLAATTTVPLECPPSAIGDKFMLGEVENVFIDELKSSFHTRIDTGAESSSLDARNILLFERDGEQWVRFDVMVQGEAKPPSTFESKVVRFVRIKQEGDVDDRRPVIHAHLKIGKYSAETDLNLTDRSHLDYPLLLGRKFIKDIAVVDVSQQFIHGK
ncbi:ATP-dependent zinc protease family protein [Shewanella litorisediminis]|uniref:ATP-dependent zinc protease n=1 Tax=Shewanella litorisediminis TaxID=1173586 RepID=A0ABX7FYL8_9GAMM|nr:ATP-dependent zinc protease [Shewanella litorisediminis]MCL2919282.1 ATP-dependent zinc protease [Shewanella litorisediminis]QRH00127.1 ATP-dependent zinc protease [Shewanella litorisediminis]